MSILTARFRRRPSSRMRRLLPEALESRQLLSGLRYEIGSPNVVDVWIDPTHGSDANSGSSRITPLRSVNAAWDLVPQGTTLGTGFRLNLMAGRYGEDVFPIWMDGRRGTADAPVILRAADGPGTVEVPAFQVNHCSFIYLVGLYAQAGGDDVLHVAGSDHILIRDTRLVGTGTGYNRPQESLKVNQTQYLFVENCDISGAWGNALDCVSVQYGWIVDSRIHDAEDWVMYLKGGSAYIHVEGNEIYGGGTGGFSAGQGTGFEYMVAPWLHYECYGITVVNNVIHDTEGAGLGVNGSYNVLMAGNTLYRVGRRSHAIEVVQGARGCDGDTARCQQLLALGGWGVSRVGAGGQFIPCKNVFIENNIVYNPADYQSQWQHFAFAGPVTPPPGSNIPSPARADDNLQIRGNLIWNGPPDLSLGIGEGTGCQPSNPTCNETLLRQQNVINVFEPQLMDPAHGDYRPVPGGNVYQVTTVAVPAFSWADAPTRPAIPAGETDQGFRFDRLGSPRTAGSTPPGAYVSLTGPDQPPDPPTPPFPPFPPVAAVADLGVTASLSPDPVAVRGRSSFVVLLTNQGGQAATGVRLTVALPGGVKILSVSTVRGWSLRRRGQQVIATSARLEPGASLRIRLVLQSTRAGTLILRATTSSASPDADGGNDEVQIALHAVAARRRRS